MVESNINWEAIGAIGTCLGAIATFWAVVVALWQTRISRKKSLELVFEPHFLIPPNSEIKKTLGLTIMNTGMRNITIQEWGFWLNNCGTKLYIPNYPIGASLPATLEPDSAINLYTDIDNLLEGLQRHLEEGNIKEKEKLIVYVRDNFSVYYKQKTECTIDTIKKYEKNIKKV